MDEPKAPIFKKVRCIMVFNVFSETLNSLITKAGTFADEFIDSFWNVIDNDYMSMNKNVGRFTDLPLSQRVSPDIPLGADIVIFIPLALILAGINLAVNVWYSYLNRDAWDAYWEKEEQKLDRIKQSLDKKTSPTQSLSNNRHDDQLIPLETITIASDPEEDAAIRENLSPRKRKLLQKIAKRLKGYQEDTKVFRQEIDAHKQKSSEKADEVAPLDDALTKLTSKLDRCNNWSDELNAIWGIAPTRTVGTRAEIPDHLAVLAEPESNIQNNSNNGDNSNPEQQPLLPPSSSSIPKVAAAKRNPGQGRNFYRRRPNEVDLLTAEDLNLYRNSYILIESSRTFIYVTDNQKIEEAKINNFNKLLADLAKINPENLIDIHLSSDQIESLITSNGGHTPYIWQKIKNGLSNFVKNFSDNGVFYTAFYYAWGYWFVFFFTIWGLPEYSVFTSVPTELTLFALICPIIYLSYKEYTAYKNSLNIDLSVEEKEELEKRVEKAKSKKLEELNEDSPLLLNSELSANEIQSLRSEVLKEMLAERARNNTKFRWGWLLVALIAGFSIGAICGLPVVGAVFVGIGVFIGTLLIVRGITDWLDKRATEKRAEMLQEAEEAKKEEVNQKKIDKAPKVEVDLEVDSDIENDAAPEAENQSVLDKSSRKAWAAARKHTLKEIEYLAACLKQEELLEKIASALNVPIQLLDKPKRSADITKSEIQAAHGLMVKQQSSHFFWAKVHQWVAAALDFLSGYMTVVAMIGFVGLDLLGNVFNITLLAVSTPFSVPVIVCTALVALLALLVATSSGYRTWSKHQEQNDAFKKQIASDEKDKNKEVEDYQNRKIDLLHKTKQTNELRERLKNILNTHKERFPNHFDALNQLLNKPVKERSWTLRRFVKGLRKGVYLLTSVSSVALVSRAICTMGFAALVPVLATGSLVVFGAAAASPLGIAILSIAVGLLFFRLAREFYFSIQHAKAVQKANHIDSKLEKRKNEFEHLEKVEQLIDKVIKQPAPFMNNISEKVNKWASSPQYQYKNNHEKGSNGLNTTTYGTNGYTAHPNGVKPPRNVLSKIHEQQNHNKHRGATTPPSMGNSLSDLRTLKNQSLLV